LVGKVLLIDKALADRDTPGHGSSTTLLGNRVLVGVGISFQIKTEPGQILLIDDADKVLS
jgi:hypothetical protein